ncbi:type I restriction-modification system subunit M N-terminal domain-containing protein [Enterococcus rivorum]|uniref:type I restriction-modification system subunit M N-terminal domain-containing protein n=1 Tax=Enterococcus rivorum TaxID=762845 RepID=UPI00363109C4
MSSTAQRAELQAQIWKIANDVRGSIDGWDFKQYVLGTLFYRFISEISLTILKGEMRALPTLNYLIVF